MTVVAVSCVPAELETCCYGTLSRYIRKGHDVHLIIAINPAWTDELREITRKNSRSLGAKGVVELDDFDFGEVTQENVQSLREIMERLNPEIVIIPNTNTQMQMSPILAKSALLASRRVGNVIMYDSNAAIRSENDLDSKLVFRISSNKLKENCLKEYFRFATETRNQGRQNRQESTFDIHNFKSIASAPVETFVSQRILLDDNLLWSEDSRGLGSPMTLIGAR